MAKNATTENAPKTGAACGKAKAPAPEKSAKKGVKADSKPSKGAKK
ncbi:MAG TPA: hypothetical protein HA306_08495 [Methanosarcina sp.]|nr:hypothetical protein [Methanosarcina sp.]